MENREHIYVAEVYCDGQRVELIAHTTREGANEDAEAMASGYAGDVETEIHQRRLYRGPEGTDPITFFAEDEQPIETNRGP